MYREGERKRLKFKIAVAVILIAAIAVIFCGIMSFLGKDISKQESEDLKKAVISASIQCYAVEGAYPPNIEYLEKHYGIIINHDKFIVSYEAYSSNLLPDVTVLEKGK